MLVRIHGFDWGIYTKRVMPAFAQWLIEGDESTLYQLYQQTRCSREELFTPQAMHQLLTWPRAQAFIRQLPRGLHAHREYQKLCSAEQFTAVSDLYIYRHPPQLYQNSNAIRAVWGALIEEYCLPWLSLSGTMGEETIVNEQKTDHEGEVVRSELISLLHTAGFAELAQAVHELELEKLQTIHPIEEYLPEERQTEPLIDEVATLEDEQLTAPGLVIGQHPATLRLRGWLAGISVRAMALFELLACGRRRMPFGHTAGEPFESYIGYLTPDEVWHLALCLRSLQPPNQTDAEEHYAHFRRQQAERPDIFQIIDEILPTHADTFVRAVRTVASQGLGMICSIE